MSLLFLFSASGSNASGNRWAMSNNLRHIPDGAEVTVTQHSLWSCLRSEMNVPTLPWSPRPELLTRAVLPFQDIVSALEDRLRPLVQAELSVLVDVLHRPELLFPENTDARRKCESGGFICK